MFGKTINPYNAIDILVYNSSGALIVAQELVMIDASPATATLDVSINPFDDVPHAFEGITGIASDFIAVVQGARTSADGDTPMMGVTIADIKSEEWGIIRTWGPCLLKIAETASDNHLTPYGIDATAGQGAEVTAVSTESTAGTTTIPWVVAFQVGTSGTTTTGDAREVFSTCFYHGGIRDEACMFGAFI